MGLNWAEHTVEIAAPIGTCFDAIVDYESFPGWQSAVTRVEVTEQHPDGLGKVVHFFLTAKGQKVDYTLDYRYQRPTHITWDYLQGSGVKNVEGDYTFEELGADRTCATYKLGIDPSLPVPGMIARRIHQQALKASVEELKTEAERRDAEGGPGAVAAATAPLQPAAAGPPVPVAPADPAAPPVAAAPPAPAPPPVAAEPLAPAPSPGASEAAAPPVAAEPSTEPPVAAEPPVPAERPPAAATASGAPPPEPASDPAREAVRASRDAVEGVVGAGREIAETVVGTGIKAAGKAVSTGTDIAGGVLGRAGRLLGRGRR